jgi:hypothetical protein
MAAFDDWKQMYLKQNVGQPTSFDQYGNPMGPIIGMDQYESDLRRIASQQGIDPNAGTAQIEDALRARNWAPTTVGGGDFLSKLGDLTTLGVMGVLGAGIPLSGAGIGLAEAGAVGAGGGSGGAGTLAETLGASESFVGPATGTVEAAGLQASGAVTAAAPGTASGITATQMSLTPGFWETVKAAGGGAASAVTNLINGGGTASDLTSLLSAIAPAALGFIGAKDQQQSLAALGDKYFGVGAPSRARFEASFAPGFTMANDPGYKDALDQTTKSTLYSLSPGGNPVGSPNAWTKTLSDVNAKFAYPALQDYRRINANTGGLASLTERAPTLETAAVNAGKTAYDAIGAGAADIFNPRKSLSDLLREAGVR